jgi:hypothetical protein
MHASPATTWHASSALEGYRTLTVALVESNHFGASIVLDEEDLGINSCGVGRKATPLDVEPPQRAT